MDLKFKNSVFIIDDNSIYLLWLNKQLSNHGNYTIHSFSSAEAALTELPKILPQVIVIDYQFIGSMNGQEALTKIKFLSPMSRVIFLSAQKNMLVAIGLIKSGADEYLQKTEDCIPALLKHIENYTAE